MHTFESLKNVWEKAAEDRSLLAILPEVFRDETLRKGKEHYQELQEILRRVAERYAGYDKADPERFPHLTDYLLMLARSIPEIDEEVFDHKMNLVREYRLTLKNLLSVPWVASSLASSREEPLPSCLSSLPEGEGQRALDRLRESIRLSCENKVLLQEKYEKYM